MWTDAEISVQVSDKKARWDNEKNAISEVSKVREEVEEVNKQIEAAQRSYALEKAAELQYGRLPELKARLAKLEETVYVPDPESVRRYERLYALYRKMAEVFDPGRNPLMEELGESRGA